MDARTPDTKISNEPKYVPFIRALKGDAERAQSVLGTHAVAKALRSYFGADGEYAHLIEVLHNELITVTKRQMSGLTIPNIVNGLNKPIAYAQAKKTVKNG